MPDPGPPPGEDVPILRLTGVSKAYRGVQALEDVDLTLRRGTVHGLVGHNGAGKSTLVRIMTGAVRPDAGRMELDGSPVRFATPAEGRAAGIAVVHQDTQLFPDMTVAANLLVGREPSRGWGPFRVRQRRVATRQATELLDRVGLRVHPQTLVGQLSTADRKFIEVGRVLAADARIVLLDEPTAAMAPEEVDRLFELLERLRAAGVAVVFISHRLAEVAAMSDSLTVLRDGRVVADGPTAGYDVGRLAELIAGRRLEEEGEPVRDARGGVRLEAREVRADEFAGPRHLGIHAGEVVALTGLKGSGMHRFARAIAGAAGYAEGEVRSVDHGPLPAGDRRAAVAAGIGLVPEDRKAEAVVPELSIEANIALGALDGVTRGGLLSRRAMRRLARRYVELLDIRPPDPRLRAGNLSGGNQQKVLVARWLASGSAVLVLEEPTHGLDVGAKADLHHQLRGFVRDGGSILMVSSEHDEIAALGNRVGVFHQGQLVALLDGTPSESELLRLASGGEPRTDASGDGPSFGVTEGGA